MPVNKLIRNIYVRVAFGVNISLTSYSNTKNHWSDFRMVLNERCYAWAYFTLAIPTTYQRHVWCISLPLVKGL